MTSHGGTIQVKYKRDLLGELEFIRLLYLKEIKLKNVFSKLMKRICQNALQYYTILPSESHRENWDNILLLLLTKIYKLENTKVGEELIFYDDF